MVLLTSYDKVKPHVGGESFDSLSASYQTKTPLTGSIPPVLRKVEKLRDDPIAAFGRKQKKGTANQR